MSRARATRRILARVHPARDGIRPRVCYRVLFGPAPAVEHAVRDLAASLACKRDAVLRGGCIAVSLRYAPADAARELARMARRWRRWGIVGRWQGPTAGGV